MMNIARCALLISGLMLTACIDPIEFDADSESRRIVIEGQITNISYNERMSLPEFPAPFMVRVQYTGPVNNERNEPITDADVILLDDTGSTWTYVYDSEFMQYVMTDDEFRAEAGRSYTLRVTFSNGEVYESAPQQMKAGPPIGELDPELTSRLQEVDIGGQVGFRERKGVELSVNIPELDQEETLYLRYKAVPSWVYVAPIPPDDSPVKTCYVTNIYYFKKVLTRMERSGGYPLEVLFLETVFNSRLEHDFTVYVTQYSLDKEAYEFWDQLALQQRSGGGIFDPPPFELKSNVFNVNDPDEKVSGFFYVAHESSVRWFINASELPYDIDLGPGPCSTPPLPEECFNCLKYRGGSSSVTNIRPDWWRNY